MEKKITIRVDADLHSLLTRTAANKKQSLNEYLIKLLTQIHIPEPVKPITLTDEQWEEITKKY